ncbi:FecR family protein [Wocania ichthyoenteri]|uniref:FecR family protein n=1 Tax=Wocania ichthyoenteri TaxID=1230531 RepID=UPI00053EFE24|nr:FecR domain-containing protein [Wocania ichthyoenteri]
MNKKQIIKYIQNDMNSIERRKTIEWIRKSPENQKMYNILKAEYIASTFIDIPNNNNDFFFERLKNNIKKRKFSKIVYATASLVILFAFLWNFQSIKNTDNISPQEISNTNNLSKLLEVSFITERGDKKEIYLPDGSKIVLNADSELSYPKEFNDSIREVTLVGEAFFDIKRDINKPFIVNTNSIKIRVLGTSFNVKSYSNDKKVETTLVTGKVELIKDKGTPIILAPSQKAVFHKIENTLEIEEVKSLDVVAWKDGTLIFDKTPLQEVVTDLERKYNTKIIINSKTLLNYEYTGTFDNLSVEDVLKLLTISSPITYTIDDDKIILE